MLYDIKERAELTASAEAHSREEERWSRRKDSRPTRRPGSLICWTWTSPRRAFDLEQFRMGLGIELEHGRRHPATNVTNDDPVVTGKIALAHLRELPDYYTRLADMEAEAGS